MTNSEIKLDIPESNGGFKRVHKCRVAQKYSDPEEDMTVPETTTEDDQSVTEISNEDDRESTGHPATTPTTRMTRSKTKQIRFAAESNNNTTSVDFLEQAKEHQKHEIFSVSTENITEEEYVTHTPHATYSVELSTKEHDRDDVKAAKQKEIDNLENYNVYEKVKTRGNQELEQGG